MKRRTHKKPILVCIFAHPDDESFGPGGTIATYAKTHDVYILCATRGEAGNHKTTEPGNERELELIRAAKILGVKRVHFLNFIDGTLSNSMYHDISDSIMHELIYLQPDILLTFEPHGVSGHLDHIAISMITTFVFERYLPNTKTLLYYCHTKEQLEDRKDFTSQYFIYFPPGYDPKDIALTVDTSAVWEMKKQAMLAHESQIEDAIRILSVQESQPKKEFFLMLKKSLK